MFPFTERGYGVAEGIFTHHTCHFEGACNWEIHSASHLWISPYSRNDTLAHKIHHLRFRMTHDTKLVILSVAKNLRCFTCAPFLKGAAVGWGIPFFNPSVLRTSSLERDEQLTNKNLPPLRGPPSLKRGKNFAPF